MVVAGVPRYSRRVGKLGTVLELMHDARNRWTTVRAEVREWRDEELSSRAVERHMERDVAEGRSFASVYFPVDRSKIVPPVTEARTRVWFDGPRRVREERQVLQGVGEELVGVLDGDWWWLYTPFQGAITNQGDPHHSAGIGERWAGFFDPSSLIPSLDLDVLGRCRRHGRPAIRVRATWRESSWFGGSQALEFGAEGYELIFDAQKGVLLRSAALIDGEPFSITEVLEIAYDETFPPEVFSFVPPTGETLQPVQGQVDRRLSLEEAVAEAPFQIWVPCRVPRGFTLDVRFVPAAERPLTIPSVFLNYVPDDAAHRLSLRETATGELGWTAWAVPVAVEHEGEEFAVVPADDEHPWRPTHVFVERPGTSIEITSDLELDTLLGIAASLAPASPEAPRL